MGTVPKILLSKIIRQDIERFASSMMDYTPRGAKTFSQVQFGKASDPNYLHEIVSFFDKENNLIGRVAKETGKADIYTEYSPWQYVDTMLSNISQKFRIIKKVAVSKNKAIPEQKIVTSPQNGFKFVLTKDHDIPMLPKNNKYTKTISEELQYIQTETPRFNISKEFEEKRPDVQFIGISRRYDKNPEIPNQICLQNNKLFGINKNINKSKFDLFLKKESKDVKIQTFNCNNFYMINDNFINNPFAPYLYLRPEVKAKYITRYHAKQMGLMPLNIKSHVNINDGNSGGSFCSLDGKIYYEKIYNICPSTGAHEVEHAYQFALVGQNGKINLTPYEERALNLLGKCPKEKIPEAKVYENAIINYPCNLDEIENLREYLPYWENDLEVFARLRESEYKQYDSYPFNYIINRTRF